MVIEEVDACIPHESYVNMARACDKDVYRKTQQFNKFLLDELSKLYDIIMATDYVDSVQKTLDLCYIKNRITLNMM